MIIDNLKKSTTCNIHYMIRFFPQVILTRLLFQYTRPFFTFFVLQHNTIGPEAPGEFKITDFGTKQITLAWKQYDEKEKIVYTVSWIKTTLFLPFGCNYFACNYK